MLKLLFSTCVLALTASSAFAAAATPTFSRDVAPILNARRVTCHRSGEAAPMALRTYAETRPWARAIKQKVASREMPPWHAEAGVNRFSNDRSLTDKEVATVVAWVDGGAPEGKPADLPAPPQFTEGWGIGTPDRIVDTGVDFTIPANGVVPYQYFDVDPGFTVDTWVQAVQAEVPACSAPCLAAAHHAEVDRAAGSVAPELDAAVLMARGEAGPVARSLASSSATC